MKIICSLLILVVVAVQLKHTSASRCAYSCRTSYNSYRRCGFMRWSRCRSTQYRTTTCYRSCVHGGFTGWYTTLGTCSKTCGSGDQSVTKRRYCTRPRPSGGGNNCVGSTYQFTTRRCNTHNCPVNGGWSSWSVTQSTRCSKTCGGGSYSKTYTRTCSKPSPRYGGAGCGGRATLAVTAACNTHKCPIHGGYSAYRLSSSGSCSKPCGGGTKQLHYSRTCTNPKPNYGGGSCEGSTSKTESSSCNTQHCPINGGWGDWQLTREGECSVSCGGGVKEMNYDRSCTNPTTEFGGVTCQGSNGKTETPTCNSHHCPINGGWSGWLLDNTGECTVSCGGGQEILTYFRTCTDPEPQYDGDECYGDDHREQSLDCNVQHCPITGGWTAFTLIETGDCSVTCGGGKKSLTFNRSCTNPYPQHGGADCDGSDTNTEEEDCNDNPCPINGGWTEFTAWADEDECDVLCGGGNKEQLRTRVCTEPEPAYGGDDCDGENSENQNVTCHNTTCGDKCPTGEIRYIQHTTNSNRYYQCAHNKAVRRDCAEGTVWNQTALVCVNHPVVVAAPPTHAPVSTSCTAAGGLVTDPSNCHNYRMCVHGSYMSRPCAAGMAFNPTISNCDWIANVEDCN